MEKPLHGMSMKINWGKGIATSLRAQGLMKDYPGVAGDPEAEMQYIEN